MRLLGGRRQTAVGALQVSDPELERKIRYQGLTEADLAEVAGWQQVLEARFDAMVDAFYDRIRREPGAWAVIERHTSVERQRPMLSDYLRTMFSGRIDDAYVAYRQRVGVVHERIDLDSSYYLAMFEVIQQHCEASVQAAGASRDELARFSAALRRLLQVDISLCFSVFTEARRKSVGALNRMVGDIAATATEQASTLEEISASLIEITDMSRQNSNSASEAQHLAQSNEELAIKSTEQMARLVEAMQRMQASAEATAKIVKTIDGIAAQTNLLSLNAAVEAARAGDAGRGFTVVAQEVRSLASRASEAARSTTDIIAEAVRSVQEGVVLSDQVVSQLRSMSSQVTGLSGTIREIAEASAQQELSVEQINIAVEQLNQATQQSAANAEEAAAVAEELAGGSALHAAQEHPSRKDNASSAPPLRLAAYR